MGPKVINTTQKVTWDLSRSNLLVRDTHNCQKTKKSKLWKIWVLSEKLSCLFYWLLLLLMDNFRTMVGIKLNKYETAPNFFLLNQNLTCNCLLIFVFLPKFDWIYLKLFWTSKQNKLRLWSGKFSQIQVKTQKSFGLIETNMALSHIY